MDRKYIAIDLKSFYASVECNERGLDPLTTNLVVADESRTEKTICLAVSPSLKALGIQGRPRLFEVVQKVKEINTYRRVSASQRRFSCESYDASYLRSHNECSLSYIIAPPRMARYIEYSTKIYGIYLKYISPDDIHVYSIDEVFIDATNYLDTYRCSPSELAMMMIKDILKETRITATAGIGSNLYLCKVAMDIVAKHIPADKNGVRIAELDEMSYRKLLWSHRPLTDFWRVGRGYVKKLEENGLYTMGDIARASLSVCGENLLYRLFGVNAELLIDHAWGFEPCLISDIKAYKPSSNSISTGQVLKCPYDYEKTKLIVREMADRLIIGLVEKRLVCDQIVLSIGYDAVCLTNDNIRNGYSGEITSDYYGRKIPKDARGSVNLPFPTASEKIIMSKTTELFENIFNKKLQSRRIHITAMHVISEDSVQSESALTQLDLFTDYSKVEEKAKKEKEELEKEHARQLALIDIRKRFGKNAIIKGMNLKDGATAIERNGQIGGHKA